MSKTIWKYQIELADKSVRPMKSGAEILRGVGMQGGGIVLWAIVDPEENDTLSEFFVRGTGHPMTGEENIHIGTVQDPHGFVWHVFM